LCKKSSVCSKAQIGFGKVKGHLGCFNPKEKQFTYWETFRDSGGGGEVFNNQLELKIKLCCAFCLQKSRKKSKE
jgi:hypothetical protein